MKNKLAYLFFTMLCCAFILNVQAQLPAPTVNLVAGKVYCPGTPVSYPVCSPGAAMVFAGDGSAGSGPPSFYIPFCNCTR